MLSITFANGCSAPLVSSASPVDHQTPSVSLARRETNKLESQLPHCPPARALQTSVGLPVARHTPFPKGTPSPEVATLIECWRPRDADRAAVYGHTSDFCRALVSQLDLPGPDTARKLLGALAHLTAYCHGAGVPLTAEGVLTPANLAACLAHLRRRGASEALLKDISSYIHRAGLALTRKAPWPQQRPYSATYDAKPPYDPITEATLLAHALDRRHPGVLALVCLGFGAGLDGGGAKDVTGLDVVAHADGVDVRAHNPERLIPVRSSYALHLAHLVASMNNLEAAIIGGPPGVSKRPAKLCDLFNYRRVGTTERLSTSRMRATWLVRHLDAGTNLQALLQFAGVHTTKRISDLVAYMAVPDPDATFRTGRAL